MNFEYLALALSLNSLLDSDVACFAILFKAISATALPVTVLYMAVSDDALLSSSESESTIPSMLLTSASTTMSPSAYIFDR